MTTEATETDPAVVLTLPAETVTNLAVIDEVEQMIASVEDEYATVPDCTTEEGYALAKERRARLTKARTSGDKARLAATKPLRDEQDRINKWWKGGKATTGIEQRIAALENEYDDAIKAVDEAKERERQAKAAAEAARVAAIEKRIAIIKGEAASAVTLEQCDEALARLADIDASEFAEFEEAATHHISEATATITARRDLLEEQEKQRQAQAEQQAALDAQKAEMEAAAEKLAQQQREADAREQKIRDDEAAAAKAKADEAARIEAEKVAEAARIEAEKAAEEKAAADAAQAKKDAAEKKKRDRELAKANAAERKAMASDAVALDKWLTAAMDVPGVESKAGRELDETISAFLSYVALAIEALNPADDADEKAARTPPTTSNTSS